MTMETDVEPASTAVGVRNCISNIRQCISGWFDGIKKSVLNWFSGPVLKKYIDNFLMDYGTIYSVTSYIINDTNRGEAIHYIVLTGAFLWETKWIYRKTQTLLRGNTYEGNWDRAKINKWVEDGAEEDTIWFGTIEEFLAYASKDTFLKTYDFEELKAILEREKKGVQEKKL